MKKLKIFILFLVLISNTSGINKVFFYSNSDVIGRWTLIKQSINYPTLDFQKDSTATLYSRGDTVYSYKYYLDKTELVLIDIDGKVSRDRILKLSKDSLVFETLAANRSVQKYIRNK